MESGSIFWNLSKLCMIVNIGHAYRNVVFKDYILTLVLLYCTYASLNTGGMKFIKLIIVWNISNLFFFLIGLGSHCQYVICVNMHVSMNRLALFICISGTRQEKATENKPVQFYICKVLLIHLIHFRAYCIRL